MPFDTALPTRLLDFSQVDRARRRRLERLARSTRTVGDLLRKVHGDDAELVERLALEAAERSPKLAVESPEPDVGGPEDPPDPGAPRELWLTWGRKNNVLSLLQGPAADLYPPWSWNRPARTVSLLDVLCDRAPPRRAFDSPTADDLRDTVVDVAVRIATALDHEREREPTWRAGPDPVLAPAWKLVLARREALRKRFLPTVLDRVQVGSHLDDLVLVARAPHTAAALGEIRLSFEPPALEIPAQAANHALPFLSCLLDWLTGPEGGEPRERLIARLRVPAWERALVRLEEAVAPEPLPPDDDKPLLGFELSLTPCALTPVQCRPKKKGTGYVSRRVHAADVPEALRRDVRDARLLDLLADGRAASIAAALRALRGHPRVFLDAAGDRVPVPVRPGRLALGVRREDDGSARIGFDLDGVLHPPSDFVGNPRVAQVGDALVDTLTGVIRVSHVSHALGRAAKAFVRGAPVIPADRVERLVQALPGLAEHVPLAADPGLLGRAVPGDERPLVALRWEQGTLAFAARVQPLPECPPETPGEGAALVCGRRGDRVVHLVRDLAGEPARVARALEPLELADADRIGPFEWVVGDPQRALATVERLRELGSVRAVWDGEGLSVGDRAATAADLTLRISSGRDWFGVEGGIEVDGARVELGALLRAPAAGHRFVEVGPRRWVALDEALRAQLAAAAATAGSDEAPRLTVLHAPLVEGLARAGATVDAPPEWLHASERLREVATLEVELPDGLQAELRPYQLDGFRWLARLAHWAPGAVLADDMGLGKTVQAVALLLRRAALGPAIVVAPTSVAPNWERELGRFAPGLSVVPYRGPGREGLLDGIGPGTVLITTYGVLALDADELAKVRFATAVLDESQAIKNFGTQRARAAHGFDAGFRLALSGTPVENRVGELYSLFAFVAPGLLGTRAGFMERFVVPIEARGDTGRRAAVAALVAPFLLRRTKATVARELPPRTDLVVRVDLGDDERALYERTRLEALARIAAAGRRRSFQVLEELTRLRRQACHPRLLDPGSEVPSAKLKTALRLLRDLREGGHRALVFSSFVSHLALLREALEADGFTLRYLDGQTPPRQRQAEVDLFQGGSGEAFLISLKAGGTGLNLTAADYVVHLDPWWNPAAEDQASDRAHRIGQQQPVTVYRLIAAGTVEEEIVALHAHKRELADALLTGGDSEHLPSTDELVALLLGSQGDDEALRELETAGRPRLRLVHDASI